MATLWNNLRVASAPEGTPGHREYLAGLGWGICAAFTPAFFRTTLASTALAGRSDRKAALGLLPRTGFVGTPGVARRNDDALLDG